MLKCENCGLRIADYKTSIHCLTCDKWWCDDCWYDFNDEGFPIDIGEPRRGRCFESPRGADGEFTPDFACDCCEYGYVETRE